MKIKLIKKVMALTIATTTFMGISAVGASAQWRHNNIGWWNSKGNDYSVGWEQVGGNWFYFDGSGYMKTGWLQDGGKWYYLTPNGNMATGWLQDGNKWYYLNQNGDMAYNAFIAGYRLGSDGAWINDNLSDMNTTTGAAVNITTGPAVNFIPEDNLHKENKEQEKLDKFANKWDDKINKEIDKLEKKENRAWQFFNN
jgi:hypothetical protein